MAQGIDPTRRQFVLGGALLATAATSVVLTPHTRAQALPPNGLEAAIPKRLGAWTFVTASGLVLPPRDETETMTYDQVLTRVYATEDGDPPVMLMIAYGGGQTGIFQVHRPEACYPAQGFQLRDRQSVPIPIGHQRAVNATFWSAQSDVRNEQLLYWTRIGSYFPESWAAEHVAIIRSNLAMQLPDGVLVRMSVLSGDPAAAVARLEIFARALVAGVGPMGRLVMLGQRV